MTEQPYPEQIDCLWLATDIEGNVAALVTAGEGSIPQAVLDQLFPIEEIGMLVMELPLVTAARLRVPLPRPDDFLDLAGRGIFAYDWSDIHRTLSQAMHAYELIAVPEMPVKATDLPAEVATIAQTVVFETRFEDTSHLNPERFKPCRRPSRDLT